MIYPAGFELLSFDQKIQWISSVLRGTYLDISCDIEFLLADITCVCLVKDTEDRKKTKATLMAGTMMSKKISVAVSALNSYNCTYYNKHKDAFDKFRDLLNWRNKFAHSRIKGDPSERDFSYVIFEYIENGKMVEKTEKVEPLLAKLTIYGAAVYSLMPLVKTLYAEQYYAAIENRPHSETANTPKS